MSESFNDRHLLWWIFKALEVIEEEDLLAELEEPGIWEVIKAPDWVLPTIKEKIATYTEETT